MLDDYYEAKNDLDPLEYDSNNDGMADYMEVMSVPPLFATGWEKGDVRSNPTVISVDDVTSSWNTSATEHVYSGGFSFGFAGNYTGDHNGNGVQKVYLKLSYYADRK